MASENRRGRSHCVPSSGQALQRQPRHRASQPPPAAIPMPDKSIENTRRKLARLYGIGLLAFVAVFGSLTLLGVFLSSLKLS